MIICLVQPMIQFLTSKNQYILVKHNESLAPCGTRLYYYSRHAMTAHCRFLSIETILGVNHLIMRIRISLYARIRLTGWEGGVEVETRLSRDKTHVSLRMILWQWISVDFHLCEDCIPGTWLSWILKISLFLKVSKTPPFCFYQVWWSNGSVSIKRQ